MGSSRSKELYRWPVIVAVLLVWMLPATTLERAPAAAAVPAKTSDNPISQDDPVKGPFFGVPVSPVIYSGSLLDLEPPDSLPAAHPPSPLKYTPNTQPKAPSPGLLNWVDTIAQMDFGGVLMPTPIGTFAGMFKNLSNTGGGVGWPPDTVGDVGPNHYIQAVNTSIEIFNKTGVVLLPPMHFNTFFAGAAAPCDTENGGDPVVVYDRVADRWIISDFALPGLYQSGTGFWQCIAISQTANPVNGGWYYYSIPISMTSLNDYPKIGVWRDTYTFTFNMFLPLGNDNYSYEGVEVWGFERSQMLAGQPVTPVSFALSTSYESLLPAHALDQPPPAAPVYLASVKASNQLLVWKFSPNWGGPPLFSGPTVIPVASFAAAGSIPQKGTGQRLDSLSPRPMMQMIYRSLGGTEALWLTHTVGSQGVAGIRWYEVRQPGGTPALYQQGTYLPDGDHRWMGSLSVDRDGNMALGYSVSSAAVYPSIRYTGRLNGEILGQLPQGEAEMMTGAGVQTRFRWGDYSAMAVDPSDDCTFYYTTEYYANTGESWQTRIGHFKFPSCGQTKGIITGVVRDADTNAPISGAPVTAASGDQKMSVVSGADGVYTISLAAGSFTMTAGPLLPGYPIASTLNGVPLTAGQTTQQDIFLGAAPNLVTGNRMIVDAPPYANGNGSAEPGERNIQIFQTLENTGQADSKNISAQLTSLTPGVTIIQSSTSYPDIPVGDSAANQVPFTFSIAPGVHCATNMSFRQTVSDDRSSYILDFSIPAGIVHPLETLFNYNFESSAAGWSSGGTNNTWQRGSALSHSGTFAWTDSPGGNYLDNTNSYVRSPTINLSGKRSPEVSFWTQYDLEPGYDYVYLDYSLDGGLTWSSDNEALAVLNGTQISWEQIQVDASVLAGMPRVALRFRLTSDVSITGDGVAIDDVSLTNQPITCAYLTILNFPFIPR